MNKVNNFTMKVKMFITSYCPLYFIIIILNLNKYKLLIGIEEIKNYIDIKVTAFMGIMVVFILISILCTIDLCRTKGNEFHRFFEIEKTGDSIISYMMTYILPLVSDDFFSFQAMVVNITLFILIGIMYIKLNLIYFNPIWLLCGYVVYKSGSDFTIITNIDYVKLKQCEEKKLKCSFLANGIYLIRKKDNLEYIN